MTRPALPLSAQLPAPGNVRLQLIPDPVRLRRLIGGRSTGWVRPGVHCDGNPDNLSQPMARARANPITRVAPRLWAIVELDPAGLPVDEPVRATYVAWLKERYGIEAACLEPVAKADSQALDDAAPADAPTDELPNDTPPQAAAEPPREDVAPSPLPLQLTAAPSEAASFVTPATKDSSGSEQARGRRRASAGSSLDRV